MQILNWTMDLRKLCKRFFKKSLKRLYVCSMFDLDKLSLKGFRLDVGYNHIIIKSSLKQVFEAAVYVKVIYYLFSSANFLPA